MQHQLFISHQQILAVNALAGSKLQQTELFQIFRTAENYIRTLKGIRYGNLLILGKINLCILQLVYAHAFQILHRQALKASLLAFLQRQQLKLHAVTGHLSTHIKEIIRSHIRLLRSSHIISAHIVTVNIKAVGSRITVL